MAKAVTCRSCGEPLSETFCNLGTSPLSNSYVEIDKLQEGEQIFPLHAFVCRKCLLVQLPEFKSPDNIFTEYAYFSSFSESWLKHCSDYCDKMAARFALGAGTQVVEIASNDGYLLQYFKAKGIPVLGVEPAANVAKTAVAKGIPTVVKFFGRDTARELVADGKAADLMAGNNVFAHVPDINDFVGGIAILLKPQGVMTLEFPHLLKLIEENQFDTIYHEHFSYLSLIAVETVMERQGLRVFDVDRLSTHGGSLRIYCCHRDAAHHQSENIDRLRADEERAGLHELATYQAFGEKVKQLKREILTFLIDAKSRGLKIAGYGAAAKGNTLLNYCGIGTDFVDFVVDKNPYKQGRLLPGSHIPVFGPEKIFAECPDYVFILPWNIKGEVMEQMKGIREWGGKFLTAVPGIEVVA